MARSFERVNVFPRRTAFENVQVALIASAGLNYNFLRNAGSLFREEALDLLRLVRCEDEAARRASERAHGKQKQLELAVALAARPKLLLLDEPTAGMSIAETRSTIALIKHVVAERSLTLLFTKHDMNVVFEIASAIAVLHHGEIIASGVPEDVRKNEEVRRVYLGQDWLMELLKVENLSVSYGLSRVLYDVSLTVNSGELVSLIGRKGVGKSTTMRGIMGLQPPAGARSSGREKRWSGERRIATPATALATFLKIGESSAN
jgi:ABC-type branched-subunit amino acid transport system ATPase component